MRASSLVAILSVAIAAITAPSVASGQTAGQDSVSVSGNLLFTQGLVNLEWHDVGATSGPSGQNASGRVFLYSESPSGAIQVFGSPTVDNVTCLGVQGNVAVVGFQDPAGLFFIQYVDNGHSLVRSSCPERQFGRLARSLLVAA
jgi:hypothetical protein